MLKPRQLLILLIAALLLFAIFTPFNSKPNSMSVISEIKGKQRQEKRAYIFYATAKPYACSVMVFANRFKEFKKDPSIDILALVSGLDENTIKQMNKLGIKTKKVDMHYSTGDANEENRERYKESNTKFHIFKDWGYNKFVYLDSDSILMANIDHLFDLPTVPTFWAPRVLQSTATIDSGTLITLH
ncbi:hypothetical protein HDV06_005229 [Boothiomyces sp. JEL0866]|nr:hypothetical protein HDV06_005229 [Boothiomyces sp. JEL0866]